MRGAQHAGGSTQGSRGPAMRIEATRRWVFWCLFDGRTWNAPRSKTPSPSGGRPSSHYKTEGKWAMYHWWSEEHCARVLQGLTGNGPACKGDKDEERFDRSLRRWALLADRQSLRGSSLSRRGGRRSVWPALAFCLISSRSDSRKRYSPPGRRSLLASLSVPNLGFVFAGGAVGRVLRFILPRRRCTMATIRVRRRGARNATRSLGVSMGFISGAENGLEFALRSRSSLLSVAGWVSRHDGVGCCCYRWREDRIFHQKKSQF